jgi:hypothetical protein
MGFKSGYERSVAANLASKKIKFQYEPDKFNYTLERTYCPDFKLPNGVYIEAKGKLDQETRSKMLAVKKNNPELDVRMIFMRGENKLSKGSKMTYLDWAAKNGFPAADGTEVPDEWLV